MTAGGFYGGGHTTKSALDVVYWAQRNVSTYYGPKDIFTPPKTPVEEMYWPYQALQSALQQAGVDVPTDYAELIAMLRLNSLFIPSQRAANTRGALLINKGTVSLSVGDGRRIITNENYRLVLRWMDADQNFISGFEYGALLPGVSYL